MNGLAALNLGRAHHFDTDAVCHDCGFDGAEWAHLKRDGDGPAPLCTHVGRHFAIHDRDDVADMADDLEIDTEDELLGDPDEYVAYADETY